MNTQLQNHITSKKVASSRRLAAMARTFGHHAALVESLVYGYADHLCKNYSGGYWEFFETSNGSFYFVPTSEAHFDMCWPDNYFEATVSPECAGLIISLFALNLLTHKTEKDAHCDLYYALKDFACEHKDAETILRAID